MGIFRHCLWTWPLCCGSRLGNLVNRLNVGRRSRQGSPYPIKKPCQVRSSAFCVCQKTKANLACHGMEKKERAVRQCINALSPSLQRNLLRSYGNLWGHSGNYPSKQGRKEPPKITASNYWNSWTCVHGAHAWPRQASFVYGLNLQMVTPKDFGQVMSSTFEYDTWYYAGYSVFFSGASVGLTNIASG